MTSVTAIIASMMVMMIVTMVMLNVRTRAGIPNKNVSILRADHGRGTLAGTRFVSCYMQWLWPWRVLFTKQSKPFITVYSFNHHKWVIAFVYDGN
jgi:hypothetical protein